MNFTKIKNFFAKAFSKALMPLAFSLAIPAYGWQHVSQSFLDPGIANLCLSNTISATNLLSTQFAVSGFQGTNILGMQWTNSAGSLVVYDGTNAVNKNFNVFHDIDLWPDANSSAVPMVGNTSNNSMTNAYANINIRIVGTSGANSAVNFVFTPLPDGVNESNTAGDSTTVAVTANTTSPVDVMTVIPAGKWIGVRKLRLKTATNTDTDATSRVDVLSVTINGFVP